MVIIVLRRTIINTILSMVNNQNKKSMITLRIINGLKIFGMKKVHLVRNKDNNTNRISRINNKMIAIIKPKSNSKKHITKTSSKIKNMIIKILSTLDHNMIKVIMRNKKSFTEINTNNGKKKGLKKN